MLEKFTDNILRSISIDNYRLFLYGSSSIDLFNGRDIDVVAVSPNFDSISCKELNVSIKINNRKCNLYLVPYDIFAEDVYYLKYGGYYSHKFALSFKEIFHSGNSPLPPLEFWLNEYKLYLKDNIKPYDPEIFIKSVHLKILEIRPTFVRPLSNYICDSKRRLHLFNFIENNIFNVNPLKINLSCNFHSEHNVSQNQREAFYNFWIEYNKHKNYNYLWGKKTLHKMKYSLENINYPVLEEYFNISSFGYQNLTSVCSLLGRHVDCTTAGCRPRCTRRASLDARG